MTLEAALRSFLIADSDILALCTNRVYVGEAIQGATMPYAIITKIGDAIVDNDVSRSYEEYLQVTCRAEEDINNGKHSYADSSKLADTIKEALRSQSVRNTQWTDSDDSFHITDCQFRGSRMLKDDLGFYCPVDFVIKYTRA